MKRIWLIYNHASGSVADKALDLIEDALEDAGCETIGRTSFPSEGLPGGDELTDVDTVVVAAGDGTINATAEALDDWPGRLLVLPGGTMNLLPKALHGDSDSLTIIAAAADAPARSMPTVQSDGNRALVAALIGPAATWVHTREAVRKGNWGRLRRAARLAWTRSLGNSIKVIENGKRSNGYRAVYIAPAGDQLQVIKVQAKGWRDGLSIGWYYLRGDVTVAEGVNEELTDHLTIATTRPVFALFDGEPGHLPVGTVLRPGSTRLQFVTTL